MEDYSDVKKPERDINMTTELIGNASETETTVIKEKIETINSDNQRGVTGENGDNETQGTNFVEKDEKGVKGNYDLKNQTKFKKYFGFSWEEIKSWKQITIVLHQPTDPSSLALARILFGFLMVIDVVEERGLGEADLRWGEPTDCRFPLIEGLTPPPLHWMCIVYLTLWIGAFGIMLGWNYRRSCLMFIVSYWYIFLLDKSTWNNHSYMFGILAILFYTTDSHTLWSMDAWRGKLMKNCHVPKWNYGILRFQIFLLYFYAGLKKTEPDWLSGRSMSTLSDHWVFNPMKLFLTLDQIDLWIIHGMGFLIDLTVGFLIYFDFTRTISLYILTAFHLMNSQMFHIGMFPFVCLATMPLFCAYDWPKRLLDNHCSRNKFISTDEPQKSPSCFYPEHRGAEKITLKQYITPVLLLIHVSIQMFLPYSHAITKGYNNWTNGLYGYSWDMMVHTWDTSRVTIKVVDNETNETMFLDPEAWVHNTRWQRHADMILQYAKCVKRNVAELKKIENISIYVDVWLSMNKRFHQRMFDPRVDLLKAEWSPFTKVNWVMPLLTQFNEYREDLFEIERNVRSWSKHSDVLFMADFPGYHLENYIHKDLSNITLIVLEGELSVVVDNKTTRISQGKSMMLPAATFHHLHTISETPSAFMYTYYNKTKLNKLPEEQFNIESEEEQFTIFELLLLKLQNVINAIRLISNAVLRILYSTPMIRRVKVHDDDPFYY